LADSKSLREKEFTMSDCARIPSSLPADLPVPPLDVRPQNGPLRERIDAAIAGVCEGGQFIHGPQCRQFEAAVADYCGTSRAVGCASGSDALLLALMALGVGPDDEVIMPSFTFFATAGAVWRLGAKPVFVDIDPRTFTIDPAKIDAAVTRATRAILPVHLFGQCAAMPAIEAVAKANRLPIIEDACQAIGAEQSGRRAGSLGWAGCFSFYPTKNLGGFGDGGMITTDDASLADQLRVLRDHGQSPRYHHATVGVNSRLDSIQAAVLNIKLEMLETWTEQRIENARRYHDRFEQAGLEEKIDLPYVAPGHRHVWNQYTIRVHDHKRAALSQFLQEHRVGTAVYYPVPLHLQECFASLGYGPGSLPATERAAEEVLSLPIFPGLSDAQQQQVVDRIADFLSGQTVPSTTIPRPNFLRQAGIRLREVDR